MLYKLLQVATYKLVFSHKIQLRGKARYCLEIQKLLPNHPVILKHFSKELQSFFLIDPKVLLVKSHLPTNCISVNTFANICISLLQHDP